MPSDKHSKPSHPLIYHEHNHALRQHRLVFITPESGEPRVTPWVDEQSAGFDQDTGLYYHAGVYGSMPAVFRATPVKHASVAG